jgi:tetratricopeptide (TPR) repeat protein
MTPPSPPLPSHRHQAIIDALQAQDLGRAIALSRTALAEGEERALYLNLRAYDHEQAGRLADALTDLKRAHALEPDDMQALNALGLAHARVGQLADARRAFAGVAQHLPTFAPAWFNLGWANEELGDLDAARGAFERAHSLDPASPEPLARLASLAMRRGDSAEARARALQVLGLAPGHPAGRLSLVRADLQDGDHEAAGRALGALLDDPRTPPFERDEAFGTLGDLRDAQGQPSEAFAAWSARNAAVRREAVPRFARPPGETAPEYIRRLASHFERAAPWPAQAAQDPAPSAAHVFLLGFPRSGTTVLEEALAAHPDVVTTQERDGLADAVGALFSTDASLDRLAALPKVEADHYRALYWQRMAGHGLAFAGKTFVDKQPYNTINLPLIARLFPEARILFSVRDPRDVVLSCFRRRFRMNASNFELLTLEGATAFYDAMMRLALVYRAKLPLALIEVRHESVTADFVAEMRRIGTFIGLAPDGMPAAFAQRSGRRAIVTPSAAQIAQGFQDGVGGAWRRYARELAPVLPQLQRWVNHFGYDV